MTGFYMGWGLSEASTTFFGVCQSYAKKIDIGSFKVLLKQYASKAQNRIDFFCFNFYPNITGVKRISETYMLKLIAVKATIIE